MPETPGPVRAFLEQGGEQVVLATATAPTVDGAVRLPAPSVPSAPSAPVRYQRVLVVVSDRADLRAAVLPHGVRAAVVAVWVAVMPSSPGLVPRPEWPPLKALRTQPVGDGYLVVARFEQPVRAANVVRELGRVAVWPATEPVAELVVDDGSGPDVPIEERDVPPDVVLAATDQLPAALVEHHVTGRAPVSIADLPGLTGPLALAPLDERVLNPVGFVAEAEGPVVALESLVTGGPRRLGRLEPTEELVRSLRPALGVRGAALDRPEAARLVAGLSMAGIPVSVGAVSPAIAESLGPVVTAALTAPVDLEDVVAREEHSVVLRRAALREFSVAAWRRAVYERTTSRPASGPTVSVVLATRRPEMLGFALRQVGRQVGADLQLVLAPHGFDPDVGQVREMAGPRLAHSLTVVPRSATCLFGEVLSDAVQAADGDLVLKMDDDDWYAPEFVEDLLLARAYSGAELVGMPSEYHYLAERDVTVRRGHRAETYAHFVAGGTMLMDRGLLREVGSFRAVRRYVDAQLLQAFARAGAATYRTHGLGYLLRRNATGHTWQVDTDYLLDPARVAEVRPGFAPSRLLAVDPADLPSRP